jgi:hypothetical protein
MKGYRKPTGIYIEVQDGTPVAATLTEVALRPSLNHVFADTWQTDPMNAAVCWRAKTGAEANAERDAELTAYLDSVPGKVAKANMLLLIEKGVYTLAELRAKYRGL